MLYLSSMERKNFMKFKKTIFLLSYQVNEAFCCTKGKSVQDEKRGIGIIFFRTENYTDVIENFQ